MASALEGSVEECLDNLCGKVGSYEASRHYENVGIVVGELLLVFVLSLH